MMFFSRKQKKGGYALENIFLTRSGKTHFVGRNSGSLLSRMKSAIRVFSKFPELKQRPYLGNHFWAKGYCVDTVGLNSEMIQKYVKYQEDK